MPTKECFKSIYDLLKAIVKNSPQNMLIAVVGLGSLGCVTDDHDLTPPVLRRLILLLNYPDRAVGGAVHDALQRMQAVRGYPALRSMLCEFKNKIAKILVRHIPLLNFCVGPLFNEPNKDFLESTIKSWLPMCVAKERVELVSELARIINKKPRVMVLDHLHNVVGKLFLNMDKTRLPELLSIVCRYVGERASNKPPL